MSFRSSAGVINKDVLCVASTTKCGRDLDMHLMTKRVASIEALRVLAIFSVILWHTGLVASLSQLAGKNLPLELTGRLVWWLGVPYFLITAGFYFRRSVLETGNPVAQLGRYVYPLSWMLLAWTCIYIATPPNWPTLVFHQGLWQPFYVEALKNMHLLATQNISLFLEGNRPVWHLWFLPALMFSLALLTLMAVYRLERYLVPLIISLYVVGLAGETASEYVVHSTIHPGLWMSATLLTAIGWWLAEREPLSLAVACSLIVGGYAFVLLEGTVMDALFHSSREAIYQHHFLGAVLFSIGIFALAIAKPELGHSTPFPFLAQFTLGVYLSHIFVLYTVRGPVYLIVGHGIPLRGALIAVIIYIFSVAFTLALTRIPILQYLVVKPAGRHQGKLQRTH
ncbi:MAG TPA: acyltransferase family protein [Nitrospira sp.]|nr:acyltransferase family protein [Nitrospira sp.]